MLCFFGKTLSLLTNCHALCSYIHTLFKSATRGKVLYFMCVCNDQERENAIRKLYMSLVAQVDPELSGVMKLVCDLYNDQPRPLLGARMRTTDRSECNIITRVAVGDEDAQNVGVEMEMDSWSAMDNTSNSVFTSQAVQDSVFGVHDPNGVFATPNTSMPDQTTSMSFQCGRHGVFATPQKSIPVLEGSEGEDCLSNDNTH